MPTVFPACMMPDGAEPCEAFQKLQAENDMLREQREDIRTELAQWQVIAEDLRAKLRALKQK